MACVTAVYVACDTIIALAYTAAFLNLANLWNRTVVYGVNCTTLLFGAVVLNVGTAHRSSLFRQSYRAAKYQLLGAGLYALGHLFAVRDIVNDDGAHGAARRGFDISFFIATLIADLATMSMLFAELLLPTCGLHGNPDSATVSYRTPAKLTLVLVEGPSGMGKTTIANVSLDFTRYAQATSEFAGKQTSVWLQALYDTRFYHDYVQMLLELVSSSGDDTATGELGIDRVAWRCVPTSDNRQQRLYVCDRFYISQIVYGILFEHDGHVRDPVDFAAAVDARVFHVSSIRRAIAVAMRDWCALEDRILGSAGIRVKRIILAPSDHGKVLRQILLRGGPESAFHVSNYLRNQAFLFERLYELALANDMSDRFDRWIVDRIDARSLGLLG